MRLRSGTPPRGFRRSLAHTYDAVAATRDERGEDDWRWPIAERFLSALRAEGRTNLLEIGAGVGYTSRWFADRGIAVMATDLSPKQVELCRAKGLEARVADMYHLGFPPGSFQAVWAMNCILHIPKSDLGEVLGGIAGIVDPNGLVYLGVWGGLDDEGIAEDDFYQPARFFSFRSDESLLAALEEVFAVEEFETFFPDGQREDPLHMQSAILRVRP